MTNGSATSDVMAEALESCAREPIHIPGSVQSFGILLVLNEALTIEQCGGGTETFWGVTPLELLGKHLAEFFPPQVVESAEQWLIASSGDSGNSIPDGLVHAMGIVDSLVSNDAFPRQQYECFIHRHEQQILWELIPLDLVTPEYGNALALLQGAIARSAQSEPLDRFADYLVQQLQNYTGYDRVLIYRFDPTWHGEVLAEAKQPWQESYMGLRFPASDIPAQARALYARNPIRILHDTLADPSPLVPRLNPGSGRELDLSFARLRAASPVHRQYLSNMGERASLVASIMLRGQLWGLIGCHHGEKRCPPRAAQELVVAIARLFAGRVGAFEEYWRAEQTSRSDALVRELSQKIVESENLEEELVGKNAGLMEALRADGIALIRPSRVWSRGLVPEHADLQLLVEYLQQCKQPLMVTASLGTDDSRFAHLAPVASGIIAIPFIGDSSCWLIWFRPEQSQQTRWAGDPRKGVEKVSGLVRLHPRQSFAMWIEEVRGHSLPWTVADIELVKKAIQPNLNEILLQAILRRAQRAEETIARERAFLRQVIDAVPGFVGVKDKHGQFILANKALADAYGTTTEQILGRVDADFCTSREQAEKFRADDEEVYRSGKMLHIAEEPIILANGSTRFLTATKTPFRGDDGSTNILAVATDITERVQAERALAESERRFRALADSVPAVIWMSDTDMKNSYANKWVLDFLGRTADQKLSEIWVECLHPDDRNTSVSEYKSAIRNKGFFESTFRLRRRDGVYRWFHDRGVPRFDHQGVLLGYVGLAVDITERVETEIALRESETRLKMALAAANMGVWEWQLDSNFIIWSSECNKIFRTENFAGTFQAFQALIHPEDQDRVMAVSVASIENHQDLYVEFRVVLPDGSTRWVLNYAKTHYDHYGKPLRMVGVVQDITERLNSQQALAEREKRLDLLLNQMPIGCLTTDLEYRITSWNPACTRILGWTESAILGQHFFEKFLSGVDPSMMESILQKMRSAGSCTFSCVFHRPQDHRTIWCQWHFSALMDAGGDITGHVVMVEDITNLHEANRAVDENARQYRILADSIQDVVIMTDWNGIANYVSPSCQRLLGWKVEDLLGSNSLIWPHPDDRIQIHDSFQANLVGKTTSNTWRLAHRDGHWVWVECVANPVRNIEGNITGVIRCIRDVTHRKQMEEMVQQSRKLEAIGQLAGGVAHDFNNILTIVMGYCDSLLEVIAADSPHRVLVREIHDAGKRGAALTAQLLSFSKRQITHVQVIDLTQVVLHSCNMLQRLIGENITLHRELESSACFIDADPSQMDQVLMNLVVNARDAMPQGGQVTIGVARVEVTEQDPRRPPDRGPGLYVLLTVADTGLGMTNEVSKRLFEPFFTTKPSGKGTGLGLATVHGIVDQAQGFIAIDTVLGIGTTMGVYFPLSKRVPVQTDNPEKTSVTRIADKRTILVVEDELAVRHFIANILRRVGYDIYAVGSASDALLLFAHNDKSPDLLLTDVVMPGMSGHELAVSMRNKFPTLKIAFMSGYTNDEFLLQGIAKDNVPFLRKPFASEELLSFIARIFANS